MSNEGRPDRLVPQAARLGKRKRGSALIQAMNERDEALKAGNILSDQHSTESQESSAPQSSKEVQAQRSISPDQYRVKPQESDAPQNGKEVQAHQPTGMNPPLFDEKVKASITDSQHHEEREKRGPSSSQEEETKQIDRQHSSKIDNQEESILIKDPEEKLEKVTFYITLPQLEKLEDMVYEYKKRTKVRRANRNDIIRIYRPKLYY